MGGSKLNNYDTKMSVEDRKSMSNREVMYLNLPLKKLPDFVSGYPMRDGDNEYLESMQEETEIDPSTQIDEMNQSPYQSTTPLIQDVGGGKVISMARVTNLSSLAN